MPTLFQIYHKHYVNSWCVTFRLLGCWRTSMTCLRRSSLSLRLLYSIWLVSSVWCCKRMSSARVFWMVLRCLNSSSCMDSWCRRSMACSRSFCVCRLFNSFKTQRRENHQLLCGDSALLRALTSNLDYSTVDQTNVFAEEKHLNKGWSIRTFSVLPAGTIFKSCTSADASSAHISCQVLLHVVPNNKNTPFESAALKLQVLTLPALKVCLLFSLEVLQVLLLLGQPLLLFFLWCGLILI